VESDEYVQIPGSTIAAVESSTAPVVSSTAPIESSTAPLLPWAFANKKNKTLESEFKSTSKSEISPEKRLKSIEVQALEI
jgi:hypothetical protein